MSHARRWLLLCVAMCGACDGVGRALVDYEPPSEMEAALCSERRCQGVLPALNVPDTPAEYGDLSSCPEPPTRQSVGAPVDTCHCQIFEVDLSSDRAAPVALGGPGSFERCRLHLRSEHPVEAQLTAARLENVHITLEGPIKLRLRHSALARVSVAPRADGAALSFDRCREIFSFSLYDPERWLASLHATHTTFVSALLEATSTRFDSVALRRSTLISPVLDADDLDAVQSRIEIGRALVSASRMNEVEFPDCGELRILGSQLSFVEASCRERIHLYSTRAQQGVFDGPIDCDASELLNASIGLGATTSLLSFESSFTNVSLCEHVMEARFRGGFGSCVHCDGPLTTGEASVCGDPSFASEGSENPCAAVASIDACLSFPDRPRPH